MSLEARIAHVSLSSRNLVLLLTIGVAISGCTSSTVLRAGPRLGQATSVATSADVRLVTSVPVRMSDNDEYVKPKQIICSEPSPDVAKIVSDVFSSGSTLSGKATIPNVPADADLKTTLALSKSYAEGVAQMTERLATIQLLRDNLYRACEAYANGAISATTYAAMVSRFDKTMITLLMGELAAGNFGRSLSALASSGSGESSSELDTPSGDDKGTETHKPSAKSNAQTTATAAGNIQKYAPEAAVAIAGDLVQMQANYLNDHNVDALKIACITSFGREAAPSDPSVPPNVLPRPETAHGQYRYNYHRAMSVWCDELVESLKRNEAAGIGAAVANGKEPQSALMELVVPQSHAVGPLNAAVQAKSGNAPGTRGQAGSKQH